MPESIDTANLIEDAQSFLAELAQNNTRDWFAEHKIRYAMRLKRPAELLVAQVARWLEDREGQIRGKLFRPQRDVRFSKDKTPLPRASAHDVVAGRWAGLDVRRLAQLCHRRNRGDVL